MTACIEDDFVQDEVDAELRITNTIDSLEIGSDFQLESIYLNNIGSVEQVVITWTSSASDILAVDAQGLIMALSEGTATITATFQDGDLTLSDSRTISITSIPVAPPVFNSTNGTIVTTSSYILTGDFEYIETETGVQLNFSDNYSASTSLPGLFIYLSNNNNSINNALEIGGVDVFNGAHGYDISGVGFNDYRYIIYFCKPFNIKVGEGEL